MVRSPPPYREIAERIVVGQAPSLAKCEARTEDYAIEIKTAENSGCGEIAFLFTGFRNG
jgi:hypothetical protein